MGIHAPVPHPDPPSRPRTEGHKCFSKCVELWQIICYSPTSPPNYNNLFMTNTGCSGIIFSNMAFYEALLSKYIFLWLCVLLLTRRLWEFKSQHLQAATAGPWGKPFKLLHPVSTSKLLWLKVSAKCGCKSSFAFPSEQIFSVCWLNCLGNQKLVCLEIFGAVL